MVEKWLLWPFVAFPCIAPLPVQKWPRDMLLYKKPGGRAVKKKCAALCVFLNAAAVQVAMVMTNLIITPINHFS